MRPSVIWMCSDHSWKPTPLNARPAGGTIRAPSRSCRLIWGLCSGESVCVCVFVCAYVYVCVCMCVCVYVCVRMRCCYMHVRVYLVFVFVCTLYCVLHRLHSFLDTRLRSRVGTCMTSKPSSRSSWTIAIDCPSARCCASLWR